MAFPTDTALSVAFSEFLGDKSIPPECRLGLMEYLKARPAYSKPTSYVSDLEQRLELLREFQNEYNKYNAKLNCTAALWSALMVAPLEQLRFLRDKSLNDFQALTGAIQTITSQVPLLLKVFLSKEPSQAELQPLGIQKKRKTSSVYSQAPDEPNLDEKGRNQTESNKCEQRDRYCVVTHAANPDICHVFPFAAKKNPDQTSSSLNAVIQLWGVQVFQQYQDLLVGDKNIIDTAPNMVALGPLLHRWWGNAIIGFEPIERIKNGIRIRVRWLPKTTLAMHDKVALDLNPSECLQPYSDRDGYVGISHSKTHQPIMDGTVIDITSQEESAIPSWDLFSLQWDLIRMVSLCGAAEASDDDDWESDDDDEAPLAKVARTIDEWDLGEPITASATPEYQISGYHTPEFQPLRSLPVQSRESSPSKSPMQSRESSPSKSLQQLRSLLAQSQEYSPSSSQAQESSLAKSRAGRVDENKPW